MSKINKKAFTLIELAMVLILIALIMAAVMGGAKLVSLARLSSARSLTTYSPVVETPGLVVWLESTLKSSFIESEVNSGLIGTWLDQNPQSDTKNNATTTGISRPSYVSNGINGLPAVKFDGINDTLAVVPNGSTDLTAWTIFVVIIANNLGTEIIGKGTELNENYDYHTYPDGSIMVVFRGADGIRVNQATAAGVVVNNVPAIYTFRFKNDVAVGMQHYKNGTSILQNQTSTFLRNPLTSTTNNNFYIASDTAMGAYLDGYIGEVIIFNRALSDFERQDIENYLSKKWRIKFY